jgi:carbon storage regulator
MLVLTRKVGERIVLDNRIVLEVLQVNGNRVRLGITAPADVSVLREELLQADVRVRGVEAPAVQPAPR